MPNTYTSPNMGLVLPIVGSDPGPDYAANNNNAFGMIDSHDHSSGKGVPITPAGISINSDLTFSGNNATALRSTRFAVQSSPLSAAGSDIGCCYVSGVDLYYNDRSGNQVRITQSGGVAGSPGSIAGLVAPASATYVSISQTFVWQSGASIPANLDAGSIILRNIVASSKGLTLNPPAAMASDFALTLPSLPGATSIMRLDTAGAMSASLVVDNATIEISSNTLRVKDLGIVTAKVNDLAITTGKINDLAVTTAKINDGAVTPAKKSALGQQVSGSSGGFSTNSSSYIDVTNLSITITTTGRPVMLVLQNDGTAGGTTSSMAYVDSDGGGFVAWFRDGSNLGESNCAAGSTGTAPNGYSMVDTSATAGVHTYKVRVAVYAGTFIMVHQCKIVVYEL